MPAEESPGVDFDAEALPPERARWGLAIFLYTAAIVAATWPSALHLHDTLPSLGDPLQHLWVMRWYRTALLEGLSPLRCMELQYPLGAPLANFSPLHLQSLLFLLLSTVLKNDLLIYNLVWFAGFLTTGLGTYALARWAIGRDRPALLAGLLAMLSGPVVMHSHFHLELMFVGAFPLFLMAWMRLLDRPGAKRLAGAVACLVLVTASAAYYLVFATVAAGLYAAYAVIQEDRVARAGWLRSRAPWLAAFATASLPPLALLFLPQILQALSGHPMTRLRDEFDIYKTPLWAYVVPSPETRLFSVLPEGLRQAATDLGGEARAYLGLVTLGLAALAMAGGTGMRRPRFWWALLVAMVVLALGSAVTIAGEEVRLPASWLWRVYPAFRLIRVPSRFKFFAAVAAALLAGGGFARLERSVRLALGRWALFAGVVTLAVLDLGHVPYARFVPPAMPAGYAWLRARDPNAAWVDVPQYRTGDIPEENVFPMYWQSIHRGRTTAGYSGHYQGAMDDLLGWHSPFDYNRLKDPNYLSRPGDEQLGIVSEVDGPGYLWAYLQAHRLDYVVVNLWADNLGPYHRFANLRTVLAPALVYEDERQAIYARDRLPTPTRPVVLHTSGWLRQVNTPGTGTVRPVGARAEMVVYNPDPEVPLVLDFQARGLGADREVTLWHDGREVASLAVSRKAVTALATPPLKLPAGLQRLELRASGVVPRGPGGHRLAVVPQPISVLVSGLKVRPAGGPESADLARRKTASEGRVVR